LLLIAANDCVEGLIQTEENFITRTRFVGISCQKKTKKLGSILSKEIDFALEVMNSKAK
jgi:hypothetical protein